MAQGKPKRYSDEHLKLLEAGVVVYPGDESFIESMRAKGVWQGGPTVTWDEFWEVSDQDVVDPAANRRDKRPRLEGDPFSQPLSVEERRMVDPTWAYPGHVRLGAAGPVTPGDPRPIEPPAARRIEPTVTETITQVDDDTVPDKRVIKKDYKPDFQRFAPGQDLGMVDPGQAYPGSVRLGVPGAVTPGKQTVFGGMQYPVPTGQDDPTGAAYDGRFETGSSDAVIAGLLRDAEGSSRAIDRAAQAADQFRRFGGAEPVTTPPPPQAAPTPERINPVPLNERYPNDESYLAQLQENEAARDEGRDAVNLSGIPLTLGGDQAGGLDAGSFGLDASGMVEEALKKADEGADVEEELGKNGAGLLSFPGDADEMGVAAPDTRVPPQLEKAVEKPKADASTVDGSADLDPVVKAELEREWGKWTYKPRERREKFMSQLNRIYMKAAWLDAIAALTGGQSRSSQYIERAVGKLETITKFDQEERVYNIWHDVYYDENGNYDPPKSKKQAAERARKLGASPAETKSIYGWAEEGEDLQQWHRIVDGEMETITTEGKKTKPSLGESDVTWIMGKPPANWYSGTSAPSTKKSIGPDGELVWATEAQIQSGGYSPLPSNDPQGAAWERVAKEAEQYLKDGNEDAAMATWEMYYSSAKDPVTGHIFGAEAAISQARLNIERSRRKMGLAGAAGPAPITEEQKVANANASDQEKVARMTTLKQEGLTQEQVKERMLLEGYDL